MRAAGFRAIVSPLFALRAVAWAMPGGAFDGVLITSPRAVGVDAAVQIAAIAHLPTYCVGPATADAARAAGFARVRVGPGGGGQALLDALAEHAAPPRRLLWLCAEERTVLAPPPGIALEPVVAYAMDPVPLDDAAVAALRAGRIDWAVLASARAARALAAGVDGLGVARAGIGVVAISAAVLRAAGAGWRAGAAADAAGDAALIAAIARGS